MTFHELNGIDIRSKGFYINTRLLIRGMFIKRLEVVYGFIFS